MQISATALCATACHELGHFVAMISVRIISVLLISVLIRHRALRDGVTRAVAFLSVCLVSVCLRRFVLYCAYTMAFSSGIFVCIPLVYLLAFCLSCMPVRVSACLFLSLSVC